MSQLKVNALRNTAASSDSITLASNADVTLSNVPLLKPGTYTTSGRPADPTDGTFIYNSDDLEMQYYCDDAGWRNFKSKGFDLKSIIDDIGGDASTYLKWACDANADGNSGATIKDISGGGNDGSNQNMSFTAKSGSTGGYWTFNGDSGETRSSLGTSLGSSIADSNSQFAICAWIYSVDWSDLPNNTWWIFNDGDWGPDGQIGFRCYERGTSGTVMTRCAAGDSTFYSDSDNDSTGWPSGAGWAFVCAVRTGSDFSGSNRIHQTGRAFPSDTNINMFYDVEDTFTAHDSSYNMLIGARPDNTSEDNAQGDRLGLIAFWLRTGGTTPMSTPETWFETIFDKTKGRYT